MVEESRVAAAVRQPRSAAIAGLVFGLILGSVILLLQSAAPSSLDAADTWDLEGDRRDAVSTAIALIPFAGIAFLWFIAVVRTSLGRHEDRFFDAVLLGSGLMFVAMLFAAAAVIMSTLALGDAGVVQDQTDALEAWSLASALLGSFGARMAAVFALTVSTAGRHTGALPRVLVLMGYLTGVLLLLTPPLPPWAQLLFPAWVMAISVRVLVKEWSAHASAPSA